MSPKRHGAANPIVRSMVASPSASRGVMPASAGGHNSRVRITCIRVVGPQHWRHGNPSGLRARPATAALQRSCAHLRGLRVHGLSTSRRRSALAQVGDSDGLARSPFFRRQRAPAPDSPLMSVVAEIRPSGTVGTSVRCARPHRVHGGPEGTGRLQRSTTTVVLPTPFSGTLTITLVDLSSSPTK